MGKRKKSSRTPQGPKKREPLATAFKCVFCNNESSVTVKIDKKAGVGNLGCKMCGQNFQTGVHYLSAPVDVYSDWIDACDAVAKETAGSGDALPLPAPGLRRPQPRPAQPQVDRYSTEDGFVEDDEADAEADYADG